MYVSEQSQPDGETQMPATTRRTALDAYMENLTAAQTLALDIPGALDNHDTAPDPETLNWGHVGDMVETRRQLQAIHDRLFAAGEYAPQAK
jgi:hypothetical protein